MADLDLTDAVDAALAVWFERTSLNISATAESHAKALVAAAAPLIAAQARRQALLDAAEGLDSRLGNRSLVGSPSAFLRRMADDEAAS